MRFPLHPYYSSSRKGFPSHFAASLSLGKKIGARGKPSTFVYRAGWLVEPFFSHSLSLPALSLPRNLSFFLLLSLSLSLSFRIEHNHSHFKKIKNRIFEHVGSFLSPDDVEPTHLERKYKGLLAGRLAKRPPKTRHVEAAPFRAPTSPKGRPTILSFPSFFAPKCQTRCVNPRH